MSDLVTGSAAAAVRFDEAHRRRPDPWSVTTRWYEIRKRAVTLAALPDERYGRALELGCSIGVLAAELAGRCDELLAVDLSAEAVARAEVRLAALGNVTVRQHDVATGLPEGPFELVVVSEMAYYLDPAVLERTVADVGRALAPGGTVLACHWLVDEPDFAQRAVAVHAALDAGLGRSRIVHHEEADFVLDAWSDDPRSVAERTGLR